MSTLFLGLDARLVFVRLKITEIRQLDLAHLPTQALGSVEEHAQERNRCADRARRELQRIEEGE